MFQVRIVVERISLVGLEALDERRRLRLSDDGTVYVTATNVAVAEVGEAFARAHFGSRSVVSVAEKVPFSMTAPGDIVDDADMRGGVRVGPDISKDRVIELWLAAKMHRLQREAERATETE